MGNALRLFVFCLALAAVGSTAAITQLWVRNRAQARPSTDLSAELRLDRANHTDHQRALVIVVAVSFVSLLAVALVAGMRAPFTTQLENAVRARGEINQVEHFARTAAVRETALRQEREERLRSDENLHIQQLLLSQALAEKLRLGRDLHDGVIQSLYATGLTLESARQKIPIDPIAANSLFDRGLQMLNESIREIRGYIHTLSQQDPAQGRSFSTAIAAIIGTMKGDRTTEFTVRIDEAAEMRLHPAQMTDALQIVREAVSNALRHGAATHITIRLHEDGERLALLIQDNGRGFDPAATSGTGHGLSNFQARSKLIGAELRLDSQPDNGTRIVITLPTLPSSQYS